MENRFSSWEKPVVEHGQLTRWNWLVQYPELFDLGEKVDIGSFTYINAKYRVTLEDNVQIGSHCSIYSVSTIDNKQGPVLIQKNAAVGSHSTIMPGVSIGKNSIVGAHSFVNKDIPDNVIAVGVPAKVVKAIDNRPKDNHNYDKNDNCNYNCNDNYDYNNKGNSSHHNSSIDSSIKIPLAKPFITENALPALSEVLKSGILSLGPNVKQFEQQFAQLIGTKYAVAVNSGTSGLHLCIKALGLGPGDEVITSPFSFIASANCIVYEQALPVFVDVEEETFNLDPALIEKAITPRTKAILIPHIFGQCGNLTAIMSIAKRHNLKVIEDSCESITAAHRGKKLGTFGEAAVFAFYPNKQMTTGEGGMIVTDQEVIHDYCRSAANQGRDGNQQQVVHNIIGYNYRLDELSAALGLTQLDGINQFIELRRTVAKHYLELLNCVEGIVLPKIRADNTHSWFVFPVRVKETSRDLLIKKLADRGIQSKAYFSPAIHLQPAYKNKFSYQEGQFPVAEKLSRSTLILPFYTQMARDEVEMVVKELTAALKEIKESDV
ncbi:MAG TPA: aminotransferase class V-fold PLP-dependent enzyme [Candidatus Nanoarchaeia archaeon]|nr:aminotransferase class V-fold PLP-dependent enzyme [Candidatus Nanoarchaeia archaeon]